MVGAVTVLIAIVAVFLAYNANNGLPFVPVYRVSVDVPNAGRLTTNNEIRIGGHRVGVVESIEPVLEEGSNTTVAADGSEAAQAANDTEGVVARLNLKLDKAAQPLPKDSIFRVRYRSAFGLKYLEVVRGTGEGAPEGYAFDGTDDGATCVLPASADEPPAKGAGANGCFQEQTEFDDINNTFDAPTRQNSRTNLEGFGDAFAGRGFSLNLAIESLRPLFVNLKPVSEALTEPSTRFRRFFPALAAAAAEAAPVAEEQAELFTFMADTFAAMSSNPEALKATISEGVPTLQTGIETLPRQRPFLRDFTTLTRALRPGVSDLRITLPTLNDALETGTPVLRDSVSMNRRLEDVFVELRQLVERPSTRTSLLRLGETFDIAEPLARNVVPAQTVCNYFNYWFTFLPNGLSDRDQVGYSFRQALTGMPSGERRFHVGDPDGPGPLPNLGTISVPGEAETPVAGYSGINANGKDSEGVFKPYELPIMNGQPYGPHGEVPAAPGREDCQGGQNGYAPTLGALRTPGQPAKNPAHVKSDIPGTRGPTTLFFKRNSERVQRYTVDPSRTPLSWQRQGFMP
jgi:ABC-type transporter Mla subunit MlaD